MLFAVYAIILTSDDLGAKMPKIDKVKSIISFIEKLIIALILALFGIISFLFVNALKLSIIQFILAGLGLVILVVVLFILFIFLMKKFKELGDLK